MIRRLLVPLDGSVFAEHALPLALSIARRTQAELQLLHVHAPMTAAYAELQLFDNTLDERLQQQHQAYLDEVHRRIADEADQKVQTILKVGDVTETLRQHLSGSGVDLVVMTTHARGPFGRFWLGSVADNLLRDVSVPLLLTHPQDGAPDLSKEVILKNYLLPLDGSPMGEQILEPALQLGRPMVAAYTLFRVVRNIVPYSSQVEGAAMAGVAVALIGQIERTQVQLKQAARQYLAKVAQRLRAAEIDVQCQVAVADEPASAIVERAVPPAIDAIALATHGRHGLPRFFLGSVADKVIRGARVPILVYRPNSV